MNRRLLPLLWFFVPLSTAYAQSARDLFLSACEGQSTVELKLGIELQPRYPTPANGDPLLALMPNSRAHVTNSDHCECLTQKCREQDIRYRALFVPRTVGEAVAPTTVSLEIRSDGLPGPLYFGPAEGLRPDEPLGVCLAEGAYEATLRIDAEGRCQKTSNPFQVEDILVVVIGDSYSSGEGAPAGRTDPGESDDDIADALADGHGAATWAAGNTPGQSPVRTERIRELGHDLYSKHPDTTKMEEARRLHHLAHRSVFAPSSRVAMMLEDSSALTSVTYVNVAVSGSTIQDGVLCPSRIPEFSEEATQPADQIQGCAPFFRFDKTQLDEVADLVQGRIIDALIVGFGGNDVGFARALEALVLREGPPDGDETFGPSRQSIIDAINTGDWSDLDGDWGLIDEDYEIAGLSRLPGEYDKLNQRLVDTFAAADVSIDRIYLMGYPNFALRDNGDRYCSFFKKVARRNQRLSSAIEVVNADNLEINEWESEWGIRELLRPLTERQIDKALELGWVYVDMPDAAFNDNGICQPKDYDVFARNGYKPRLRNYPLPGRWFRAGEESFAVQSSILKEFADNRGLGHPNESGYLVMAYQLRDSMIDNDDLSLPRLRVEFPESVRARCDQPNVTRQISALVENTGSAPASVSARAAVHSGTTTLTASSQFTFTLQPQKRQQVDWAVKVGCGTSAIRLTVDPDSDRRRQATITVEGFIPEPDNLPGVWTELVPDTIDGRRCGDLRLPGCGPPAGACGPVGAQCLAVITRDDDTACKFSTRSCERRVCDPSTVKQCDVANGTGEQRCNEFGSELDSCIAVSCQNGYSLVSGSCRRQVCDVGEVQDCTDAIDYAREATRTCRANRTGFGQCKLIECMSDFRKVENRCELSGL